MGPVRPFDPAGPFDPVGPGLPTGPGFPAGPAGPTDPVAPGDPVGPAAPCGPIGPTGPTGPVAPTPIPLFIAAILLSTILPLTRPLELVYVRLSGACCGIFQVKNPNILFCACSPLVPSSKYNPSL